MEAILERPERSQGHECRCLACEETPPYKGNEPGTGWLVGVLRRQCESGQHVGYEVTVCPEHKLYAAPLQPEQFHQDRKLLMAGDFMKLVAAKCAHCGTYLPPAKKDKVGWAVARLERWRETKVYSLTLVLCPKHTLAAGP